MIGSTLRVTGFVEGERAVADYAVAVAGGIAGIAEVDQLRLEAAQARGVVESSHRRRAARLLVRDVGGESQYRLGRGAVDRLRVLVRHVVRKVGADDDQGFRSAPE